MDINEQKPLGSVLIFSWVLLGIMIVVGWFVADVMLVKSLFVGGCLANISFWLMKWGTLHC